MYIKKMLFNLTTPFSLEYKKKLYVFILNINKFQLISLYLIKLFLKYFFFDILFQ